jgi:cytochrome c oxidase subunit 2
VIDLVEYIKNLDSDYRVQQSTATTTLLPEGEGKTAKAPATQGAQGPGAQGMVKQ